MTPFSFVHSAVLPLSSFVVLCGAASADVRVVGTGQAYTSIQQAINAASSGDTILVRAGNYLINPTIDGKALNLIGDDASRPTITGQLVIRNLPTSKTVVVSHLVVVGGVYTYANDGFVRVADCQVGLPNGNGNGFYATDSRGGVAIASCSIYGLKGPSDDFWAGPGGNGILVQGAVVAVHDCTIRGGNGGSSLDQGGTGGDGAHVQPSATSPATYPTFLHASGSTFTGGTGGDTYEDVFNYWAYVGFGGDGFDVASGANAWRIGSTYTPGAAGQWHYCYPASYGGPGQAEVLNGFAATFAPVRLAMTGPTLARESTSITLQIQGAPGDLVSIGSSQRPAFNPIASWRGVRLNEVGDSWFLPPHSMQTSSHRPIALLDASGQASVTFTLPALHVGEIARSGFLQVFRVASDGTQTLGSFVPLTIVDSTY